MQILPGDVLFVSGHTLLEEAIELVSHGPSHVAMFLTASTLEEAQGGRLAGEVDLSFYTDGKSELEVWGDPSLTDAERTEMVSFAHTLFGKHYDYVLIPLELLHFEFGLPLGWYHNENAMICSVDIERIVERIGKRWTLVPNPAPIDLMKGGVLQFKVKLV